MILRTEAEAVSSEFAEQKFLAGPDICMHELEDPIQSV